MFTDTPPILRSPYMKFLIGTVLLLLTFPAIAGLLVKHNESNDTYRIHGDMDALWVSEQSKQLLPSGLIQWPTKNGIWVFVTYGASLSQPPIYAAPNLSPTDNPNTVLNQVASSQLSTGIPIDYGWDGKTLLILMICDYKTNDPMMRCKMASSAKGEIPPPKPAEPTTNCSIAGSIDLHHGNLSLEAVNTNRAYTTAYVTCSRSATVSIAIEGMVKLNGVEGLYSQLSVGGMAVGKDYSFTADSSYTPVLFESVLRSSGTVTPGNFSGSARVVLTFP